MAICYAVGSQVEWMGTQRWTHWAQTWQCFHIKYMYSHFSAAMQMCSSRTALGLASNLSLFETIDGLYTSHFVHSHLMEYIWFGVECVLWFANCNVCCSKNRTSGIGTWYYEWLKEIHIAYSIHSRLSMHISIDLILWFNTTSSFSHNRHYKWFGLR